MGGLQAQYAPSMYIGLWSRVEGLERSAITRALQRRTVVQGTLMRSTIHLVSAGDYWPFAVAVEAARRAHWLRARPEKLTERQMAAAARKVRAAFDGVIARKEVHDLIGSPRTEGVQLWLHLVRAPPAGTWEQRRAHLFALAEEWVGPPAVELDAATDHLMRRYLAGFGPASVADVISFTGLPRPEVLASLERLPLRRFADEAGGELLDLRRAPLPDPDTPAPVRLLPTWDASLLVHARRAGVLPEEYRSRIFHTRAPQSFPTFLVDGAVAGTWRYEKGRIELDPFRRLDAATMRELRAEAERMAAFHA
jgi:hypothetical protein